MKKIQSWDFIFIWAYFEYAGFELNKNGKPNKRFEMLLTESERSCDRHFNEKEKQFDESCKGLFYAK